MGMFDSFYDERGREWQTKAFDCDLDVWRAGDPFPVDGGGAFQVEVIGDGKRVGGRYTTTDSFVTIAGGVVAEVPAERDEALPLIGYSGSLVRTVRYTLHTHPTAAETEAMEEQG